MENNIIVFESICNVCGEMYHSVTPNQDKMLRDTHRSNNTGHFFEEANELSLSPSEKAKLFEENNMTSKAINLIAGIQTIYNPRTVQDFYETLAILRDDEFDRFVNGDLID